MPALRRCRRSAFVAALLAGASPAWSGAAAGQDAAQFSPTYAASQGSPYRAVYARTFGAPPLETAAPPPAAVSPALDIVPAPDVVYVIEGGRLLTYRAEDYARGEGPEIAGAPVPVAKTPYGGFSSGVRAPTVTDRLYGTAPE
jgi:hypothetical protein